MPVSVSLLSNPQTLAPLNSELWFRTDSTSSGLTDFKYIFTPVYKLEPFASTAYTITGSYRVPPRPDGGNGLFSPHRNLKSYVLYNVNPYINLTQPVTKGLIQYQMKYGCEYNPNLRFTDTISVSGSLGLTFSTPHDLSVGDIITVNKDNKNFNPQYDGTASITSIVNTYSIRTNKTFSTTLLAGEAGSIDLVSKYSGTSSTFYGWSGTKQYLERDTDFTLYFTNSSSAHFLTNEPDYTKVALDDYQTISFILPTNASANSYRMSMDFYDANGNQLFGTTSVFPITSTSYLRNDFGIGPMNLTNSTSLTMSLVDTYRCYITLAPDAPGLSPALRSEYKYFKIDRTCSSYTKTRICFLNRRGGFDYFNFTLDNKKQVDIKRTEYQKDLAWNYNIGDRGQTVLSISADAKYTANSNWLTEKESIWLEELLTSPEVYILGNLYDDGDPANSYKQPIIITDNSYEVKTYMRNQMFNLILNYRLANDINLQNE